MKAYFQCPMALAACLGVLGLAAVPRPAAGQCSEGTQISDTCGDVSFQGCCLPDDTLQWCENGVLCGIACAENVDPAAQKCGWSETAGFYNCGASTLPEPTCTHPYDCPGNCVPCGDVLYAGCCEGLVLTWCECGCLRTIDCSLNTAPYNTCGWNASAGYYDCGQTGADPSGEHPIECSGGPCVPSCGGKQCGDDGCGGSCGTCPAGYVCNASGLCEMATCTPDCAGKQCGDDGCGGSCGTCPAGQTCQAGTCAGSGCGANPDLTCLGNCGWTGTGGCECDEFCEFWGDCCPDFAACCPDQCTPDCFLKDCGDDGCGGSCGTCPAGQTCNASGQCVATCNPDCAGKQCGSDGCGGTCGSCPAGQTCNASGQCVATCNPDCAGKQCGDDGCGGTCGSCPAGQTCNASGQCVATCNPDCAGKQCGDDGCGGTCGSCAHGLICQSGTCMEIEPCTPDCAGKECGPDGCDGSCGVCPPPLECSGAGQCYDPSVCSPSCAGKECGPDGCNGSCGSCPPGATCNASGRCEAAGLPDASSDPASPGESDAGGPPAGTGGRDFASGCPPGYVWNYGKCQTTSSGADGPGRGTSGGGCTVSPQAAPTPLWWMAMAALGLAAFGRRRGPPGS